MRRPRRVKCARSDRFPRGEKFVGAVEHRGAQRWVGTFATQREWSARAVAILNELREAGPGAWGAMPRPVTIGEFAGVTVAGGRVVPREGVSEIWPWTHLRNIRKESSAQRTAEALRPFVRRFEDRELVSFTRVEARGLAAEFGAHTCQALRRLFEDAIDDEALDGRNPFAKLGRRTTSRLDDPDFAVISEEQYQRFAEAAIQSHDDDYGAVLRIPVVLTGRWAMRPSEVFAVEHRDVLRTGGGYMLNVRQQVDWRGVITPVKNELKRRIPLHDEAVQAIEAAPRLSDRWLVPAPRGGKMTLSQFFPHWAAVRALAGRPDFQFYELKHHAITWMVTPPPHGLGLMPQDAAVIAGHTDGGRTIAKHYLKLNDHLVAQRAWDALAGGRTQPDSPSA